VARAQAKASVVMNRRIRNRASGGVGGRRGLSPRFLPDFSQLRLVARPNNCLSSGNTRAALDRLKYFSAFSV
jgi:hypothetical protein